VLDNLAPLFRHLALVALAAVLTVVSQNVDAFGLSDSVKPIVAALVTIGVAWVTPLTRQYGVGLTTYADDLTGANVEDPLESE
jgi:hypothetical protein